MFQQTMTSLSREELLWMRRVTMRSKSRYTSASMLTQLQINIARYLQRWLFRDLVIVLMLMQMQSDTAQHLHWWPFYRSIITLTLMQMSSDPFIACNYNDIDTNAEQPSTLVVTLFIHDNHSWSSTMSSSTTIDVIRQKINIIFLPFVFVFRLIKLTTNEPKCFTFVTIGR